jgi:hypothetical protein
VRAAVLALALLGCVEPLESGGAIAERFTYQVRVPGDLVPIGGFDSLEAPCDPGDLVVGGGCQVAGGILGSYPLAERAGWICSGREAGAVIVYAICESEAAR